MDNFVTHRALLLCKSSDHFRVVEGRFVSVYPAVWNKSDDKAEKMLIY